MGAPARERLAGQRIAPARSCRCLRDTLPPVDRHRLGVVCCGLSVDARSDAAVWMLTRGTRDMPKAIESRETWKWGDPLPEDTLWTKEMVAYYIHRSTRTVERSGCPNAGIPGRYEPRVVRAFFTGEFQRVGIGKRRTR